MDSRHLNFPKVENAPHELDCVDLEENPFGNNCSIKFDDFEDISGDFALLDQNSTLLSHEDIMVDAKPLKTMVGSIGQYYDNHNITNGGSSETLSTIERESGASSEHGEQGGISGRKRTAPLELDEIQKYFDFPISKAAKEMNVGLTMLKKRCRELNIMRWPHRKIKSLKSLIENVKELGLTNEIMMLEEHKRVLEKLPDMELTERTKKLRQACFKANYKRRRSLAACY